MKTLKVTGVLHDGTPYPLWINPARIVAVVQFPHPLEHEIICKIIVDGAGDDVHTNEPADAIIARLDALD